jgi:para-nitrobenzyl esterase
MDRMRDTEKQACRIPTPPPTILFILFILSTLPASALPAFAGDEVRIDTGVLKGAVAGGVASFKGIPYAAAPVGDLRWRAPQPPASWQGVRAADSFGAMCMQSADPFANAAELPPMSEDCLTLNVWTAARSPSAKLPVMVWIHGGSFHNGTGAAPVCDGSSLARQGVVVVTLNYRLGRFGFFAHPALSRERPQGPVANYGLFDMIAALRWVATNIHAFGGDPANVTIFGESSGAAAVNRLMIAPPARGLFHRAIQQSGNGREYTPRLRERNPDGLASAEDSGKEFAASMGVTNDDVAALRAIPAERIVAAGNRTAVEGGPVIDGVALTMEVAEAFQRGHEAPVPFISGSTSLELPLPPAMLEQTLARAVTKISPEDREAIARGYASEEEFKRKFLSDFIFREPARFLAAAHAKNGHPTYLYRFDVLSASMRSMLKGAPHASELAYVFGTLKTMRWAADGDDPTRSSEIAARWTHFAKRGDPNSAGLDPAWPRYASEKDLILDFTNAGPVVRTTPDVIELEGIAATY